MIRLLCATMALSAGLAHAGFACRDLSDPEGRRWFQDEPCGPGFKHDPLPEPPLIHEAPRIPDSWGRDGGGSEWQVLGFNERGRVVGVWVPAGRAVPFVSTDTLRVNRGGGRRGRR